MCMGMLQSAQERSPIGRLHKKAGIPNPADLIAGTSREDAQATLKKKPKPIVGSDALNDDSILGA